MIRLLRIEAAKVMYNRPFWVMLGLYFFLFAIVAYAIANIELQMQDMPQDLSMFPIMEFPDIWHNITYLGGFFNLILAFIVIMVTANEYTFRTLRQHLIDGLTRVEFLGSKYLLILCLSTLLTLFMGVLALIFGFANTEAASMGKALEGSMFLIAFFVQTFAYLSLAMFFALLLRKAVFSIGLFVLYTWLIEKIPGWILDYEFLQYLPSKAMDRLIQFPLYKYMGQPSQTEVAMLDLGVNLGYIALFMVLSWVLLSKRDL